VQDFLAVGVCERLENLRAHLDGGAVVELAVPKTLAERLATHVLVGDVDVLVVALEGERAQAPGMAKPGRGLHLPLSPRPGLAFSRDDLERDVACGPFVPHEPDRARTSAAERPQGPESPED
jgi:hypothetical protein